jgi:hypothetical protein
LQEAILEALADGVLAYPARRFLSGRVPDSPGRVLVVVARGASVLASKAFAATLRR